ncbi:MAG: NAD-dependent epimerase/dehydratase family protein [Chitinophagaceae bacterium]|nr:NAD-dependent epimerase/dehydratase family protein [Chitinophagaceae bacterium]
MRVLVTGGSGFIGSRLVEELLKSGHNVRILDKAMSSRYPDICQIGNVCDPEAVDRAVKDVDLVYHLAAEHRDDVRPISLYYEVNVDGSKTVAEACASNGVKQIVFTSSVAIYGLNAGTPTEATPPNPFNDYGRSKFQAEEVLHKWYSADTSRQLTIVRPTVVFGEGNRGNVFNLVKQITSGHFVMVGNGNNRKSMAYVGNVAAFLNFAGPSEQSGIRVYNYVDKPDLSMNELVGKVRGFMGKSPDSFLRIPYGIGMAGGACFDMISALTGRNFPISRVRVKKFCADTTISVDALKATGFTPPFTLGKGMEMFLDNEFGGKES